MGTHWIIIVIVSVVLISLVIYLVIRNMKDKNGVVGALNETDIDDDDDSKRKIREED